MLPIDYPEDTLLRQQRRRAPRVAVVPRRDARFDGLREIAAGVCGLKLHDVVELPEGTPKANIGRLAELVKQKRAQRSDLPPCCRMVKELGHKEKPQLSPCA